MTKFNAALKDKIVVGVMIVVFVVLTFTSTVTMQRSFDSASRSDTKALISYVRCLIQIPRDAPSDVRLIALDQCAENAIRRESK